MSPIRFGAALLCAATISHGAFAHALLQHAQPPVGGSVSAAPTEVVLIYSEGVEPRFSKVEVQDDQGRRVDQGTVATAPDDAKKLIVPLKPLAVGTYRVDWHVTSVDTHKTEGKFSFTVTH
jgi:methionine-rich copper-binding protein CopC